MGALLLLLAGGQAFEAFSKYRQAKKEAKSLEQQRNEILQQRGFVERFRLERHRDLSAREESDIGRSYASTAKAGLLTDSGSAKGRREAISIWHGRQKELLNLQTNEELRRLDVQAALLRKKLKEVRKAGRLGLLSNLLGAGFNAGYGAYKAGLFSSPSYSSSVARAAFVGSGAYGGTMGGGPTGGYSRSIGVVY